MIDNQKIKQALASFTESDLDTLGNRFGVDAKELKETVPLLEKYKSSQRKLREGERARTNSNSRTSSGAVEHNAECSFCLKYESEVERMVIGTTGFNMCDECIELSKQSN